METVASLHSPYGRVKVKPFNFSREVQSTKSGQSIHKGMVPLSTKSLSTRGLSPCEQKTVF